MTTEPSEHSTGSPLPHNVEEAVECFEHAGNLNAAVKKMIKSDAGKDPRTAKFTKALRSAVKSSRKDSLSQFVRNAYENYEEHLRVVLRNAHAAAIDPILDEIIESYAESFNESYTLDPATGEITVTDESSFTALGSAATSQVCQRIAEGPLPSNNFMKSTLYQALFDPNVLTMLGEKLGPEKLSGDAR
ncbi:hypothetical protein MRY87_04705 [bacterium]|nr:hypothetical protein [bacterium]